MLTIFSAILYFSFIAQRTLASKFIWDYNYIAPKNSNSDTIYLTQNADTLASVSIQEYGTEECWVFLMRKNIDVWRNTEKPSKTSILQPNITLAISFSEKCQRIKEAEVDYSPSKTDGGAFDDESTESGSRRLLTSNQFIYLPLHPNEIGDMFEEQTTKSTDRYGQHLLAKTTALTLHIRNQMPFVLRNWKFYIHGSETRRVTDFILLLYPGETGIFSISESQHDDYLYGQLLAYIRGVQGCLKIFFGIEKEKKDREDNIFDVIWERDQANCDLKNEGITTFNLKNPDLYLAKQGWNLKSIYEEKGLFAKSLLGIGHRAQGSVLLTTENNFLTNTNNSYFIRSNSELYLTYEAPKFKFQPYDSTKKQDWIIVPSGKSKGGPSPTTHQKNLLIIKQGDNYLQIDDGNLILSPTLSDDYWEMKLCYSDSLETGVIFYMSGLLLKMQENQDAGLSIEELFCHKTLIVS